MDKLGYMSTHNYDKGAEMYWLPKDNQDIYLELEWSQCLCHAKAKWKLNCWYI